MNFQCGGVKAAIVAFWVGVFSVVSAMEAESQPATQPTAAFTLGKETTIVSEPLLADGRVDYVTALDFTYRKDVLPRDNTVVDLLRIVGPTVLPDRLKDMTYRRLHMRPLDAQGSYWEDLPSQLNDELEAAGKKEWRAEDHTSLAAWLDKNKDALDKLSATVAGSTFYYPVIATNSQNMMLEVHLHFVPAFRALGEAATARAMLRLGQGDERGFETDVLAVCRLGRLLRQHPMLIPYLAGLKLERKGAELIARAAADGKLSAETCARIMAALDALPRCGTVAQCVAVAERWQMLDTILSMATAPRNPVGAMLAPLMPSSSGDETSDFLKGMSFLDPGMVDWDVALRKANAVFDALSDGMHATTWHDVAAKVGAAEADLQKQFAATRKLGARWVTVTATDTRATYSARMGDVIVGMLTPNLLKSRELEAQCTMELMGARICLALAIYRSKHQDFPRDLDRLVAEHMLTAVPTDFYSGQPLIYRRTEKGFLLYSVGKNEKDDQGRAPDDFVIYSMP